MRKKIIFTGASALLFSIFAYVPASARRTKNFRMMPKHAPVGAAEAPEFAESTGAARGEKIRLMAGRWTPEVRAALDQFIEKRGKGSPGYDPDKPPVAVLPWSDALVVGDPAELVFLRLTTEAKFRFNDAWWQMVPIVYGRQPARTAYENFIQLSSSVWQSQPDYSRYRKAILESYIGLCRGVGRRECRQYLMRLWAGWKEEAAVDYARRVIDEEKARPAGVELILAEEGDKAALHVRRGLRLIPEMRDLAVKLRAAGVDVWIVDDLPQPVLSAAASDYGIDPSRIIGVRAKPEGSRMSGAVLKPIPTRGGKTELVQSALGRPADFVLGRDAADSELLAYGEGLRIVLSGDSELTAKAREKGWLIQPSLAR